MRDKIAWSEQDIQKLKDMVAKGNMFYTEIAEHLGRQEVAVSYKARQLGLINTAKTKRCGEWNKIHKHLREPVMKYFVTHTWDQTIEKFKVTNSQLKSIFTVGYRDPKLKHLRKETRRHDAWSAREYKFLLQHSGFRSRQWIAEKLNRGGYLGIKDRLDNLGISSKNLNGLTISQFREAFGQDPDFYIQTTAGPTRALNNIASSASFYKIIPWGYLKQELKCRRLKTHKIFKDLIYSMALFQDWVFDGNALYKIKRLK